MGIALRRGLHHRVATRRKHPRRTTDGLRRVAAAKARTPFLAHEPRDVRASTLRLPRQSRRARTSPRRPRTRRAGRIDLARRTAAGALRRHHRSRASDSSGLRTASMNSTIVGTRGRDTPRHRHAVAFGEQQKLLIRFDGVAVITGRSLEVNAVRADLRCGSPQSTRARLPPPPARVFELRKQGACVEQAERLAGEVRVRREVVRRGIARRDWRAATGRQDESVSRLADSAAEFRSSISVHDHDMRR